jgi:hypothetical protein
MPSSARGTASIGLGELGAVFVSSGSSVEGFEENSPAAVIGTDAVFTCGECV